MTIDLWVAFVIFLIALAGLGITSRKLRISTKVLRLLDRTPGSDPGVRIMTVGHIRADWIRLYIHAVFIFTGIIQIIPHQRYDVWWWIGLTSVLTMQLLLIYSSIAAGKDASRAAHAYIPK